MKNQVKRIGNGIISMELTQGKRTFLYEYDYPKVQGYRWHVYLHRTKKYAMAHPSLHMHRLIMSPIPEGMQIDHVDGDGLNNLRENLRICNRAENMRNRHAHKNNTSGFKGVYLVKSTGLWKAEITVNWKKISLGCFSDRVSAALTYDEAARKYHGEFARVNL